MSNGFDGRPLAYEAHWGTASEPVAAAEECLDEVHYSALDALQLVQEIASEYSTLLRYSDLVCEKFMSALTLMLYGGNFNIYIGYTFSVARTDVCIHITLCERVFDILDITPVAFSVVNACGWKVYIKFIHASQDVCQYSNI